MKKLISTIALSLFLSVSVVPTSQAGVAIGTGGVALGVVGFCVGSYGVGATGTSLINGNSDGFFTGLFLTALGILTLDEDGQSIQLSEINQKKAFELGISEDERLAFNTEKEEISLITNGISKEATSVEEAALMWDVEKENISINALNAYLKVLK